MQSELSLILFFACSILNKLGYALFADFIFLQVFVALSNGDLICYARDHTKDSQWDFTNKKCLPGKLTSLFILCIHLYYQKVSDGIISEYLKCHPSVLYRINFMTRKFVINWRFLIVTS